MKKLRKIAGFISCFITAVSLLPLHSIGQSVPKEVNIRQQTWLSINSNTRLNKKFGIVADVHMRRNHVFTDPGFYFVRIGASYWVKENVTAVLGYGNMWMAPVNPKWRHFAQEHRIYQQIQASSKIGKIGLTHRLRNEQRWQEKIVNDAFIHKYKFTDRIRYLLSLNIPVFKNAHYPSLIVSDELCIQFGKEIVYNTFDQNRAFIGIKQQISKSLNFDLGYMLVYQEKASGYQYDRNNTFRLFFYYTPDCRKKQ